MGSGLYEIANARNDERSKPKPPGSGPGRLREKPCFQMNRTKSIPQGLKHNVYFEDYETDFTPSLRDSGCVVGCAIPTLKRGVNNHCAYGAGSLAAPEALLYGILLALGLARQHVRSHPREP